MNKFDRMNAGCRSRAVSRVVSIFTLVIALVCVFVAACSRTSDEEQIRAVIDAAEQAAEARDTSDAMALIADDYRDAQGLDKTQLRSYLRGYFIAHPKIELLVHIGDVKVETATTARVHVEFALVGTQVAAQPGNADRTSLAGESESLLIEFKRIDNEWRVSRVDRTYRE